jgi:hypothetical protein
LHAAARKVRGPRPVQPFGDLRTQAGARYIQPTAMGPGLLVGPGGGDRPKFSRISVVQVTTALKQGLAGKRHRAQVRHLLLTASCSAASITRVTAASASAQLVAAAADVMVAEFTDSSA